MKLRTVILTFIVSALSLFTCELYAQETNEMSDRQKAASDSIQKAHEMQNKLDRNAIDDAKEAKNETKIKEKEAVRIKRDASDASVQSKKALKMEKNAQKSRRSADQQSKRASDARDKSDNNSDNN